MGKEAHTKRYRQHEKAPYWNVSHFGDRIMNGLRTFIGVNSTPHEHFVPDVQPPMILKNDDTSVMKFIAANVTLPGGWIVQRNSKGIAASHVELYPSLNPTVAKCIVLMRDGNLIIRANGNMVSLTERVIGDIYPFDMQLSERNKNVITNTISKLALRLNDMKVCCGYMVDRNILLEAFDGNVVSCLIDGNKMVLRSNNCQWLDFSRICHECREIAKAICDIEADEDRKDNEMAMDEQRQIELDMMMQEQSEYERRLTENAEIEQGQSEIAEEWRQEPKMSVNVKRVPVKTVDKRKQPKKSVSWERVPEMDEGERERPKMDVNWQRLAEMAEDERRQSKMAENVGSEPEFSEDER